MDIIHFGPQLAKIKLNNEDLYKIIDFSKFAKYDSTQYLAGQIEYEKSFDDDINDKIIDIIKPQIIKYLDIWLNNKNITLPPYIIKPGAIWLNIMKANEYNPIHMHTLDLSFVIYLNVPNEIHEEKNLTKSIPMGAIEFMYGKDSKNYGYSHFMDPLDSYVKVPENGDMFIFPSNLYHHVQKFTSDVERISMAGNISILF